MGRRRGYLTVDVDLSDAIEAMTDEMLLEEVKSRKLNLGRDDFDPVEDLQDAYAALLRGQTAEAKVILDRLLRPKWSTARACEIELMTRRRALPQAQCNKP